MIESFLDSWSFFAEAYLSGFLIATFLPIVGVWVVARDQIFLGAAVSQASTFGIAVALWLGGILAASGASTFGIAVALWLGGILAASGASTFAAGHQGHHHGHEGFDLDTFAMVLSIVFAVGAVLWTSAGRKGKESNEAVTGWVFLFAASGSMVLIANIPHGLERLRQLHSSSIIGADYWDVGYFSIFALLTVAGYLLFRRPILLLAMDPEMARATGMHVRVWTLGLLAWLGLGLGLSIHATGVLHAFGCLILPVLQAKILCRESRSLFWVAPLFGVGLSAIAFVGANQFDYPPAQFVVAVMAAGLALGWFVRYLCTFSYRLAA